MQMKCFSSIRCLTFFCCKRQTCCQTVRKNCTAVCLRHPLAASMQCLLLLFRSSPAWGSGCLPLPASAPLPTVPVKRRCDEQHFFCSSAAVTADLCCLLPFFCAAPCRSCTVHLILKSANVCLSCLQVACMPQCGLRCGAFAGIWAARYRSSLPFRGRVQR